LSSRNLANVKYCQSREVNAYDVMLHDQILISRAAIESLQEALAR